MIEYKEVEWCPWANACNSVVRIAGKNPVEIASTHQDFLEFITDEAKKGWEFVWRDESANCFKGGEHYTIIFRRRGPDD